MIEPKPVKPGGIVDLSDADMGSLRKIQPGTIIRMPVGLDPRVPIIAGMAATIFAEKQITCDDAPARRFAVTQAFLLYGEIVVRLATSDKIAEDGQ